MRVPTAAQDWKARFARFCVVGAAGAAVYYLVLVGLVELARLPVLVASSVAFTLVVLENYVFHYAWTFASNAPHRRALPQFIGMSAVGFGANAALMWLGVERLGLHYLLVQTFAVAAIFAWNFAVSHSGIFRARAAFDGITEEGGR